MPYSGGVKVDNWSFWHEWFSVVRIVQTQMTTIATIPYNIYFDLITLSAHEYFKTIFPKINYKPQHNSNCTYGDFCSMYGRYICNL